MTQEMPLEGLRVLDLATVIAGPLSSALLADFGADVVKVELPNGSDGMRALPPFKDGVSLWGKVTNRIRGVSRWTSASRKALRSSSGCCRNSTFWSKIFGPAHLQGGGCRWKSCIE